MNTIYDLDRDEIKRNDLNLPSGPEEFTVDEPRYYGKEFIVNAANFGVSALNYDNRQAFIEAILFCKKVKAARLVIPGGVYHIRSGNIVFEGFEDFTVEGNACELIFGKYSCLDYDTCITIKDCNRVSFKDIIIDWDWENDPIASRVKVVSVDKKGDYVDLEFVDEHDMDREIIIKEMFPLHPKTMTIGYKGKEEIFPGSFKDKTNPTEDELVRKPEHVEFVGRPAQIDRLGGNTIRAWTKDACFHHPGKTIHKDRVALMETGDYWLARHYSFEIYGFYCKNNTHLTLAECKVYSCPGIGFFITHGHHIKNVGLTVTKRPGSNRFVSSAADHYHVHNTNGYFIFDNCDFGYGGDDCINIHDEMSAGVEKIDSKTIFAKTSWKTPFKAGDIVEFRNEDLSPTGFTSTIAELAFNEDRTRCTMVFDKELPEILQKNTVLFWRTYGSGNYIIRNCKFHDNRARGVILHTPNGIVENCTFYNNSCPAMQILTGYEPGMWCEGMGVENLIVRNNRFENANSYGIYTHIPAVRVTTYNPEDMPTKFPILKNILFENNTFIDCSGVTYYLSSCENLTIMGNKVINKMIREPESELRGGIFAVNGINISILNNIWFESEYTKNYGIVCDEKNIVNLKIANNTKQEMR